MLKFYIKDFLCDGQDRARQAILYPNKSVPTRFKEENVSYILSHPSIAFVVAC